MDVEVYHLKILGILTIGLTLASLLGYLSKRAHLSPILGYLLGGYLIGPYSPGFVADLSVAEELAEVGVALMMFGVGLHFKFQDLVTVKKIAIPGAIGQTFIAATVAAISVYLLGWPLETGLIIGLAIGVASTVVLVRVLSDYDTLDTAEGHIAIGWLIVEDVLTVGILLFLPMLSNFFKGEEVSFQEIAFSGLSILLKLGLLIVFIIILGKRCITYFLIKVAKTHVHELFTVTLLALTFVLATGSSLLLGTSIALGAFIAGMMIGQTEMRHQAAANSLPLKDAFSVIFFLSVGMLFNPGAIAVHLSLFITVLAMILLIKPIVAFLIMHFFGYSLYASLSIAVALAQIGEFSFILAESALKLKMLPDDGYDVIVAAALVSIAINPLWFRAIQRMKPSTA